jgi:hypothetical protein
MGGIAAIAIACGAGISAQSSDAQSKQVPTTGMVTITGCLKPVENTAIGTTGSTTAPRANGGDNQFMLTNATITSDVGQTPGSAAGAGTIAGATTGTRPASGTAAPSSSSANFALDGHAAELRPHLNHQIDITGRLDPMSATAPGTPTPATSPTPPGVTTTGRPPIPAAADASPVRRSAHETQRLHVESVRMIAATCPIQ